MAPTAWQIVWRRATPSRRPAGSVLRVRIAGVHSFAAYGQLQSYLRSVDLIQSADLLRVNGGDPGL